MHYIVLLRHIFFVTTIACLMGLTVLSGMGVANSVILSPAILVSSLLMMIYFLAIIVLDLNRTRNGFGYYWFVFQIWWEILSVLASLTIILILSGIAITRPQGTACLIGENTIQLGPRVCSVSHGIWAWELIFICLMFCYLTFIGAVVIEHYYETPRVLRSSVRDFNWKTVENKRPPPYGSSYGYSNSGSGAFGIKRSASSRSTFSRTAFGGSGSTLNLSKPLPPSIPIEEPSIPLPTFDSVRNYDLSQYRPQTRFTEGL